MMFDQENGRWMLLLLLGCTTVSVTPDSSMEVDAVLQRWKQDQTGVLAELRLKSEEEKILIIRQIIEDPDLINSPKLCHVLRDSDQRHCQNLMQRSHIWEYDIIRYNQQKETSFSNRKGPSSSQLIPSVRPILDDILPLEEPLCSHQQDLGWCYQKEALKSSIEDIEKAARLCTSIEKLRHREECFFQISEHILQEQRTKSIAKAIELCQHSQTYASHCYAHNIEILASFNTSKRPSWKQIKQFSEHIGLIELEGDPLFTQQLQEYYWTLIIKRLYDYGYSNVIPDDVPTNIQRHIRSAKTFVYIANLSKADKPLGVWRKEIKETDKIRKMPKDRPVRDLWLHNGNPIEEAFQATFYLTLARRPYVLDEDNDWDIAIVMALLQHQFPTTQIDSEQEVIRWLLRTR